MTDPTRVVLIPRDGFMCKDGRGWGSIGAGRGHSLEWPWPSTVLGSLKSAWGRAEEVRSECRFNSSDWLRETAQIYLKRTFALRRPLASRGEWKSDNRLWPIPADATLVENRSTAELEARTRENGSFSRGYPRLVMMDPVPPRTPTLGRDDDEARELLWRPDFNDLAKPVQSQSRWWDEAFFTAWLTGIVPDRLPSEMNTTRRVSAHVGICSDSLTAEEGILFSHDVIETLEQDAEWAIAAEVTVPKDSLPRTTVIGSDGRTAMIESLPSEIFDPPSALLDSFKSGSSGLKLVVVTPALFERGWLPDGFTAGNGIYIGYLPGVSSEVILRAAFIQRPLFISGWDMSAGAAKTTSSMVAPGGIYFFERTDGIPFSKQDAESLWLAPLGGRTEEGFGRVVPGVWNTRSSK